MKRPRSPQGSPPSKRPRVSPHPTVPPGNQPQTSQWAFNGNQVFGYLPELSSSQHPYPCTFNNVMHSNNSNVMHSNNRDGVHSNDFVAQFSSAYPNPALVATQPQLPSVHPNTVRVTAQLQFPSSYPKMTKLTGALQKSIHSSTPQAAVPPPVITQVTDTAQPGPELGSPIQMQPVRVSGSNVASGMAMPTNPVNMISMQGAWNTLSVPGVSQQPNQPRADGPSSELTSAPGKVKLPPAGPLGAKVTQGQLIGRYVPGTAPFQLPDSYGPPTRRHNLQIKKPGRRHGTSSIQEESSTDLVALGEKQVVLPFPGPTSEVQPALHGDSGMEDVQVWVHQTQINNGGPAAVPTLATEPMPSPEPMPVPAPISAAEINKDWGDDFEASMNAFLDKLEKGAADERKAKEQNVQEETDNKLTESFEWPGDPAAYPAESSENLRLPGCQYRAWAICVGMPQPEWMPVGNLPRGLMWAVYAVRRPNSDGQVDFRLAICGATAEQVANGEIIQFNEIQLNVNFADMDENQVVRWSRYLLAAVPGINDTVTMWSPA